MDRLQTPVIPPPFEPRSYSFLFVGFEPPEEEEAHRAGLERVVQAGAQPVTWVALAVGLQRDWGATR